MLKVRLITGFPCLHTIKLNGNKPKSIVPIPYKIVVFKLKLQYSTLSTL